MMMRTDRTTRTALLLGVALFVPLAIASCSSTSESEVPTPPSVTPEQEPDATIAEDAHVPYRSCGGFGEACCADARCEPSLVCREGTCRAADGSAVQGQACIEGGQECLGGACLAVGAGRFACSLPCPASGCIAGWRCEDSLCKCTVKGAGLDVDAGTDAEPDAAGGATAFAEVCNGADDDCNGVIDDGASAQCASELGPGHACVGGSCVCKNTCDGACVDVDSNVAHCGACGNECTAPAGRTALCIAGECAVKRTLTTISPCTSIDAIALAPGSVFVQWRNGGTRRIEMLDRTGATTTRKLLAQATTGRFDLPPYSLVASNGWVYFYSANAVYGVDTTATPLTPVRVSGGTRPIAPFIAATSSSLFWSEYIDNPNGGVPTVVLTGALKLHLSPAGTAKAIGKIAPSVGARTPRFNEPLSVIGFGPFGMAGFEDVVAYSDDLGTGTGDYGPPALLESWLPVSRIRFDVDDAALYYISNGTLKRVARGASVAEELGPSPDGALVAKGPHVWVTSPSNGEADTGFVIDRFEKTKGGSAVRAVPATMGRFRALASDEKGVVYTYLPTTSSCAIATVETP